MTLTNHAAAGALIALTIKQPALVLLLAFLSHFAMDALPHFGYPGNKGYGEALKHKLTYLVIFFDIVGLLTFTWIIKGEGWLVYTAALLAILPDFTGAYNYFGIERRQNSQKLNGRFARIHRKYHRGVQWRERPWGIIPEIIIAVSLLIILGKLI